MRASPVLAQDAKHDAFWAGSLNRGNREVLALPSLDNGNSFRRAATGSLQGAESEFDFHSCGGASTLMSQTSQHFLLASREDESSAHWWRFVLPLLLGMLASFLYLLPDFSYGCQSQNQLDIYSLFISVFPTLTLGASPMFLLQIVGLCPIESTVAGKRSWRWPIVAFAFQLFVIPSVLVGIHLSASRNGNTRLDHFGRWLGVGPGVGYFSLYPGWLVYGIGVCCFSRRWEQLAEFTGEWAVESKIFNSHFANDLSAHRRWLSARRGGGTSRRTPGSTFTGSLRHQTFTSEGATGTAERCRRPLLLRHPLKQWLLVGLFLTFTECMYAYGRYNMELVLKNKNVDIYYVAIFYVFSILARPVLTMLGFLCDTGKSNADFSGFYCGAALGFFFHFFFFRDLFLHSLDWSLFCVMQILQTCYSWTYHALRSTSRYYNFVRSLVRALPAVPAVLVRAALLCQPNVSPNDWACFVGLEMSMEAYTSVYSVIVYAGGFAWLLYGWNREIAVGTMKMFDNDVRTSSLQLAISFVLEIVNTIAMEMWFRRSHSRFGALKRLHLLFKCNLFLAFVCFLTSVKGIGIWPGFFINVPYCD